MTFGISFLIFDTGELAAFCNYCGNYNSSVAQKRNQHEKKIGFGVKTLGCYALDWIGHLLL